jgi:glyoxylase-like metal-dependent hydrolase (beta-lactamase superfamily II)
VVAAIGAAWLRLQQLSASPEGNLCIDPVEPSEAVLEQIAGIGATRILLTNRNHTRAANLLRSRIGARTAIHPKDADYARSQGAENDDSFDVGERIGPLRVIGIPGKSGCFGRSTSC